MHLSFDLYIDCKFTEFVTMSSKSPSPEFRTALFTSTYIRTETGPRRISTGLLLKKETKEKDQTYPYFQVSDF